MMQLPRAAMVLAIIGTLTVIGSPQAPSARTGVREVAISSIPLTTDDNLDPITLVFTGYAPSWWVASNIADWSDSAYCSGTKSVNGNEYNYTLEHPDPGGIPCYGPRDHIRIWDMGYSPVFGQWSIAAAHHEHTLCNPLCHHVIDSWEKAEGDVRSAFTGGQATASISNVTLGNTGYYQGVFNDGNATRIQLRASSTQYPVLFIENGLSNRTSWSVTMNGTTLTTEHPAITFSEPNGTYPFTVGAPEGYSASPSSGTINVDGAGIHQAIRFAVPWSTSSVTVYPSSENPVTIVFAGNATVATRSVHLTTMAGNTRLGFNITEIGPRGVLNVTIPRATVLSGSSVGVYVDGRQNDNTKVGGDASHFYVYFLILYGTHSVELQFVAPTAPILLYVTGGVLAASIVGLLFIVFNKKKRANGCITLNS